MGNDKAVIVLEEGQKIKCSKKRNIE